MAGHKRQLIENTNFTESLAALGDHRVIDEALTGLMWALSTNPEAFPIVPGMVDRPAIAYEDLLKRDKLSLDLFWMKDKSLTDTDSLPPPDVLATEIADDLQTALDMFTKIAARFGKSTGTEP